MSGAILFLRIVWFHFSRDIRYPLDILAVVLGKFLEIAPFVILWSLINANTGGNSNELTAYLLIANGVSSLVFGLNTPLIRLINASIKSGEFKYFAIKPVGVLFHFFCRLFGENLIYYMLSVLILIAGIILATTTQIALTLEKFGYFGLMFIIGFVISISVNILISSIAFYSPDINGIRNVYNHIFRLLSGAFIPVSLFPPFLQSIALFSPFPYMSYAIASGLTETLTTSEMINRLLIGLIWAILLIFITRFFWLRIIRTYDVPGS